MKNYEKKDKDYILYNNAFNAHSTKMLYAVVDKIRKNKEMI